MKRSTLTRIFSVLIAVIFVCMVGCNDSSTPQEGESADAANPVAASEGDATFNATGMPIMSAPITLTAFWEGQSDYYWDQENAFIKKYGEMTNVFIEVQSSPDGPDGLAKRNLQLASGDYPDIMLLNHQGAISKSDAVQYGMKEQILVPITQYIDDYGVNMKRIFDYNPFYRETATAPDGEIYGVPRFSECYHCGAYPKFYMRTDWLDAVNMEMPETTEELRAVLTAFVTQDPNGNGEADEIGVTGANEWNSMVEYAIMNSAFQTVKPDFWLSYADDLTTIEISPATDGYREGLRYIKSLYDEGLIDPAAFTQKADQMAMTIRTEPHIVGLYSCDHPGMGYDQGNPAEAEIYQNLPPVAGPTGFRRQGDLANEGEVQGFYGVITDKCAYPEAAYRFMDEILLDFEIGMERMYGPRGEFWDYAPEGTKDVFGGVAKFEIKPFEQADLDEGRRNWGFENGPQDDLAPARLSMLPEVDDIYLPASYEQRITLDSQPLYEFKPEKRLQYKVFVSPENASEFSEIETNLNSFFRSATVQFIMGDRDIETGWDQYLEEMNGYNVNRYVEIYKEAAGLQ